MNPQASRLLSFLLSPALAAVLAACSGSVSAPPTPVTPGPLAITPSTATLYAETPTTFVISGGTPPYVVISSDQTTVPVAGTTGATSFTVVPNQVAADTPVTLTVRDSGTATPATAALTVKPRTVSNVVTVTPSASQPATCGTSVCAGGDAEVRATLAQNGVALAGRTVRFDVVSGDVRIITSAAGLPEALSTTGSTTTDASGTARMRVRVLVNATAQTALLQITDVSSGSFVRTSVPIAPSSASPLNAQPSTIAFTGPNSSACANGISADVIVFGGRAPYSISRPGSFNIDRDTVTASGGRFTITANGQCTSSQPIAIVDTNGTTVTVTASNSLGEPLAGNPLTVTPNVVTLNSCNEGATVVLAGGTGGPYTPATGSDVITVSPISTNQFSIRRRSGSNATGTTTVQTGFTDGQTVTQVAVNLAGTTPGSGGGTCP